MPDYQNTWLYFTQNIFLDYVPYLYSSTSLFIFLSYFESRYFRSTFLLAFCDIFSLNLQFRIYCTKVMTSQESYYAVIRIKNAPSWDVMPIVLVNAICSEEHTSSTSTIAP